jgi:hypothetical protein
MGFFLMCIKVEMRELVATFQSRLVFLEEWYVVEYSTPRERYGWLIEKTCQVFRDVLQSYGKIEWKGTLSDLEKAPDATYQDVLNEFYLMCVCGGVGGGEGQRPYCDS